MQLSSLYRPQLAHLCTAEPIAELRRRDGVRWKRTGFRHAWSVCKPGCQWICLGLILRVAVFFGFAFSESNNGGGVGLGLAQDRCRTHFDFGFKRSMLLMNMGAHVSHSWCPVVSYALNGIVKCNISDNHCWHITKCISIHIMFWQQIVWTLSFCLHITNRINSPYASTLLILQYATIFFVQTAACSPLHGRANCGAQTKRWSDMKKNGLQACMVSL